MRVGLGKFGQQAKVPVAFACLVLGAACSSTGFVTRSDLSVPRTVRLQTTLDPEVAPYTPRFVAALESHGFRVGKSDNPHALELRLDFNGNVFNMRVAAGLWHDGVPILTASATNSGWGTALARGSAVGTLADSAATNFEKELQQLVPHLRVTED